jgi:hypothetical protein
MMTTKLVRWLNVFKKKAGYQKQNARSAPLDEAARHSVIGRFLDHGSPQRT